MANPVIKHASLTGAAANPNVLVDGPKWDAEHSIDGLDEFVQDIVDLSVPGVVTLEQFGGGVDVADNGPLLSQACANGSVTVVLGQGTYRFVTPVVISQQGVRIFGSGPATVILFQPIADGTCITFSRGSSNQAACGVRDLQFYSADSLHTKTALAVSDVSAFELKNVIISGSVVSGSGTYWSGGSGSIAIKTNGRDTSSFSGLRIVADKPLVIGLNPNLYISADHFHFHDCEFIANGYPNITVLDGTVLTNTTFDGFQAWVRGTHGFYASDASSTQNWYNVCFRNVRTENGTDSTAYSFYLSPNSGNRIVSVTIDNCNFDEKRKGIYARRVKGLFVRDCKYDATTATEVYNVDSSVDEFVLAGNWWESGATVVNSGLTQVWRAPPYGGGSSNAVTDGLYTSTSGGLTIQSPVFTTKAVRGLYILDASAVAVPLTGTISETVLKTITVPAGVMGTNGIIRVWYTFSNNNNANQKRLRIRFSGNSGLQLTQQNTTTQLVTSGVAQMANRGATNSQVYGNFASLGGFGATASALVTNTIDTTVSQTIVISGQLVDVGDTMTLESYLVELLVPN